MPSATCGAGNRRRSDLHTCAKYLAPCRFMVDPKGLRDYVLSVVGACDAPVAPPGRRTKQRVTERPT